jgi:hypothetical protein
MTKTVAIVQSNYIPWKGYFDLIGLSDEFILFDEAQYTKRDWRNRNRLMPPHGPAWLSIPVEVKGKYHQRICDATASDPAWRHKHWATITHSYARAPHFHAYGDVLERLYLGSDERALSTINRGFIEAVCQILGITTELTTAADYGVVAGKTERLVDLCVKAGATTYLSGPAARAYLDEEAFARRGISLLYMDYSGYPEYDQLYPPFEHGVSILDLLFMTGPEARAFMKS